MTNAQDRRIQDYVADYDGKVAVSPNCGPGGDRALVRREDGLLAVIAPDGEVLGESQPSEASSRLDFQERGVLSLVSRDLPRAAAPSSYEGYDTSRDALLVERCDGEWALLPPWRCAMGLADHVPPEGLAYPLAELREWAEVSLGTELRVFKLKRDGELRLGL